MARKLPDSPKPARRKPAARKKSGPRKGRTRQETVMSQENEQLAEAIRNALAAAEAATDAAAEAAAAIEGQLRGTEALQKAQRRLGVLTIAATGGALLSVAVSALVYFRSVADLREASELQAAATGAWVQKFGDIDELVSRLDVPEMAQKADLENLRTDVLTALAQNALPEDPPAAAGGADLEKLRTDVLTAIAAVELQVSDLKKATGGEQAAQLTMMLGETLRRLEGTAGAAPAKSAEAAPAPKPKPVPVSKPASGGSSRPKPAPKPAAAAQTAPEPSPFSYP